MTLRHDSSSANTSSPSWTPLSRPIPLRRRRSKGTTVSFIDENAPPDGNSDSSPGGSVGASNRHHHSSSSASMMSDDTDKRCLPRVAKSAHAARIALACINASLMKGSDTRMLLTPQRDNDEDELTSGDEDDIEDNHLLPEIRVASSITERTAGAGGSDDGGKLAFGLRKLKFFDNVTAQDREEARAFLKKEHNIAKKKDREALVNHLKRAQAEEKGVVITDADNDDDGSSSELNTVIPPTMSLSLNAALILDSLAFKKSESLEGMSKCYEGLVAAGTALLDEEDKSLVSAGSPTASSNTPSETTSRATILDSMMSLLITSLEDVSGEALLALAHLRAFCGTARYRRRFVQRVAPVLVRPGNAALWCLRHQNDMASIVAAVELLLDNAQTIFSPGWIERGRLVVMDGRRNELLDSAARQLRSLSSGSSSGSHRRGSSLNNFKTPSGLHSESTTSSQSLAEWEVLAVDRHIRLSLGNLFTKNWTPLTNSLPPGAPTPTHSSQLTPRSQLLRTPSVTISHPMSPRALKIPLHPPDPPLIVVSPSKSPTPGSTSSTVTSTTVSTTESKLSQILVPPQTPKSSISIPSTPPRSPSSPPRTSKNPGPPPPPANAPTPPSPTSHVSSAAPPYYRNLTGSAAERKRTVAACRALRAQISRFEDAFIQLHGRPPKGAAERAPLATTYAQYREWKRAIRADAACRIQAMVRGAVTRVRLGRMGGRVARLVARRGRNSAVLKNLSIPVEIGELDQGGEDMGVVGTGGASGGGHSHATEGHDGVEVIISPTGAGVSKGVALAPLWGHPQPNRRDRNTPGGTAPVPLKNLKTTTSSNHSQHRQRNDAAITNTTGPSRQRQHHPVVSTIPVEQPFDPFQMDPVPPSTRASFTVPLAELLAKKRELKNRLKQYDMDFAREHGRMPIKSEKEPIRHLYEQYNQLKSQIHQVERGNSSSGGNRKGSSASAGGSNSSALDTSRSSLGASVSSGTDSSDESGREQPVSRPRRPNHLLRNGSAGGAATSLPNNATTLSSASNSITNTQTPTLFSSFSDLTSLKAEKGHLHQMLRSYEKDFYREHKRQVSSFADIRPVADQYRRYKEIKKQIAAVQAGGAGSGSGSDR